MPPLGRISTSAVWALSCSRVAEGDGGAAPGGGPAAPASSTSAPAVLSSASQRPVAGNMSATEDGLLLELQAERAGLRRRGIMEDQVMLSLGGLAAIAVIAVGGVYRYRQRRTTAPPAQVLGRLLEDQEMSNGFGNSG
mmetsp:Transcript_90276/g.264082  ORF Transcript_90276/g.264082 Transcript_90276/m.264082 type:complete len:138 (+) Transcript_90276:116-529(+)